MYSDGGYHGNGMFLWPWMCARTCTCTHIHSSTLPRSHSISSCIPIRSYRCPHKYHPSWFWLAHSRGGGSRLVMVLISHNALQPLAPTAPAASSSIFMRFLMNMQMKESGGVQVNNCSSPIRGCCVHLTPRGERQVRKWHLRTLKATQHEYDFNECI